MAIGVITDVVRKRVGSTTYYYGSISSDKLKELTFVPVIEQSAVTFLNEESEDGYQRPGSHSRMRQFKRFLQESPDMVVPPILISGRGLWDFTPISDHGDYGELSISAPAAIVDGQHRAGGYILLYQGDKGEDGGDVRLVDFILINEKDMKKEIEHFVVVNNTQRGVPKSLTAYLDDTPDVQVAWGLNVEEDSPLKDRITRTSMSRKHLFALHSVAKQIQRMFDFGGLSDLTTEAKTDIAIKFWTIIADQLPTEWSDIEKLDDDHFSGRRDFEFKLLELTGFIAWSRVGNHILSRTYQEALGIDWAEVERLISIMKQVDWRKKGEFEGMTGEFGGAKIAAQMERVLTAHETEEQA